MSHQAGYTRIGWMMAPVATGYYWAVFKDGRKPDPGLSSKVVAYYLSGDDTLSISGYEMFFELDQFQMFFGPLPEPQTPLEENKEVLDHLVRGLDGTPSGASFVWRFPTMERARYFSFMLQKEIVDRNIQISAIQGTRFTNKVGGVVLLVSEYETERLRGLRIVDGNLPKEMLSL